MFIDCPNPLACVINPIAVFVAGLLLDAAFWFIRILWKRVAGGRPHHG